MYPWCGYCGVCSVGATFEDWDLFLVWYQVHGGILCGDRCLYYSHLSDGYTLQTISGHASHTIFCLRLTYYRKYLWKVTEIDKLIQEWR